ncbi:MAG: DUF935 family protein [Weeksellaceae bacterium]|nr:DUF935 family protein [Weeksellaceae bacterium]
MKLFNNIFGALKTPKNISKVKPPKRTGKNVNLDRLIDKITKQFKDTSQKDIDKWRMSLIVGNNHERPRFNLYADLVDDLRIDGTFKAHEQLRVSATLSTGFQIRNKASGEINEEATELFNQKWFFDYLQLYLHSIIYGAKVIEFINFDGHKIEFVEIPKRNTATNYTRIYPDLANDQFIDYKSEEHKNWVLQLGEDDFGLINNIIPNLIWKRNIVQSWAEFCEKFGMPLVSATTNRSDEDHLDAVEQQLLSLAEASVGVFPEGTSIKFDEANRTDAYNVYSKFIEQHTNEISSVMVGSNTLTENAANRSQTEVHERSLDFKISQADRRDIAFNVNDELIPLLIAHGYSQLSNDDVLEWVESKEEIDLNQYWTIVQGIMQDHEVEPEWLSQTFNVPIIGKKQRQFNPFQNTQEDENNDPDQKNKNTGVQAKWRKPDYI